MTRDDEIKRIEKERREREEAMLLLLLALSDRGRVNVNRAIRVGGDWLSTLESVLFGDETLDFAGGIPAISRVLADTYLTGYQSAGKILGVELDAPLTLKEAATALKDAAVESLQRVYGYLKTAIAEALKESGPADRISADVAAVNDAFTKSGWTPESNRGAVVETTRLVVGAYNAGAGAGYRTPQVTGQMTGLVFVNPLDGRTTQICRRRAGTRLPPEHPWWDHNWPPLHDHCRSIPMPFKTAFVPTIDPPLTPPPLPGFGERLPGWVMTIDKMVSDYRRHFGLAPHDPTRP